MGRRWYCDDPKRYYKLLLFPLLESCSTMRLRLQTQAAYTTKYKTDNVDKIEIDGTSV